MAYIIGLLLVLGVIFSTFGHINLSGTVGSIFDSAKNKIDQVISPKNQREIIVDNIAENYNLLDQFLSDTGSKILSSKDLTAEEKKTLTKIISSVSGTKSNLTELQSLEAEDKNIIETLVDKILGTEDGPQPTSIPPQCRLECSE